MKIKVDSRATAKLSGTLSFSDLEKLPQHSQITLLQCGAVQPKGIVEMDGRAFLRFRHNRRRAAFRFLWPFVASDGYVIDEDMTTLMHRRSCLPG